MSMTAEEYQKMNTKKVYSKPAKDMFVQSKVSEAINKICITVPGRSPEINYHDDKIEVNFDGLKFELRPVK